MRQFSAGVEGELYRIPPIESSNRWRDAPHERRGRLHVRLAEVAEIMLADEGFRRAPVDRALGQRLERRNRKIMSPSIKWSFCQRIYLQLAEENAHVGPNTRLSMIAESFCSKNTGFKLVNVKFPGMKTTLNTFYSAFLFKEE